MKAHEPSCHGHWPIFTVEVDCNSLCVDERCVVVVVVAAAAAVVVVVVVVVLWWFKRRK